jgi:hypothetical protein
MLVDAQPDRSVQASLNVSLVGVHFQQFQPSFRGELLIERTLESVLRLFLVVETLSEFTEDFPLGTSLAVRKMLSLEMSDFSSPDRVHSEILSRERHQ